jgi:hypothetical protein
VFVEFPPISLSSPIFLSLNSSPRLHTPLPALRHIYRGKAEQRQKYFLRHCEKNSNEGRNVFSAKLQ